jgi:hypothetical protein
MKRGLFRLWVFVAVCWIAAAGTAGVPAIIHDVENEDSLYVPASVQRTTLDKPLSEWTDDELLAYTTELAGRDAQRWSRYWGFAMIYSA